MHKRFWAKASVAAALVAAIFVVWSDPVSYSVPCFNPDRMVRSICHQQLEILETQMSIKRLSQNPAFVRDNRDRILSEYRRLLASGVDPAEVGMDHEQLRRMLDNIVNQHFGTGT